ncbi:MAG: hypothetical protein K2G03_04900 [Bacilli bacterium]|nr:hypothetical protein [Bacilli bacterium]
MENYGKIIRNFINFQICVNANYNNCINEWRTRRDYQEVLAYKAIQAFSAAALYDKVNLESMDEVSMEERKNKLMSVWAILEVYVDMYKILNLREKLGVINDIDAHLLEILRECMSVDDVVKTIMHEALAPLMREAINFSGISIYDKVLQTKALDDEDIAKLKSMFPLFEGEYEAYNVVVDEAFMIRQMSKRTGPWKDNVEKCYDDAANFLDQYSILNNSLYLSISEKTGCSELNDTKGMLIKLINKQ